MVFRGRSQVSDNCMLTYKVLYGTVRGSCEENTGVIVIVLSK